MQKYNSSVQESLKFHYINLATQNNTIYLRLSSRDPATCTIEEATPIENLVPNNHLRNEMNLGWMPVDGVIWESHLGRGYYVMLARRI